MKSLMLFFQEILHDMGDLCNASTALDFKTVQRRVDTEGLSFLTITLPSFAQGLERALHEERAVPSLWPSFRSQGRLPAFLRGFTELVFDTVTGELLSEPSSDAIYAIRQISLVFGKVRIECTEERTQRAFQKFVQCESEVRLADKRESFRDERYNQLSSWVLDDLFSYVENSLAGTGPSAFRGTFLPGHGPGNTAEKLTANGRYMQREWTERLEKVFPATEWLIPNFSYLPELSGLHYREPGTERPVRVVAVPKTLKTPRIIAIEPACMMYVQQGLFHLFATGVSRINYLASSVNGPYQEPNQLLAKEGSISGLLATLDLSEASDRVSNQHVRHLLRKHPLLSEAVDASRSRKADVKGHGVLRLAKFASMGSALCFPMEALVFLTVVLHGIDRGRSSKFTRRSLHDFLRSGRVRIFGDDIIVAKESVMSVMDSLEAFGFKVNTHKSFWNGSFRESCGKEYFMGNDVSVVRLRSLFPTSRTHGAEIERTVKTRNHFYRSGMWRTVRYLDSLIERLIPFPAVEDTSQALGKFSFLGYQTDKWDLELQRPLVRAAVARRDQPADLLEGYGALLKYFLNSGDLPSLREGHLYRAGRPGYVHINTRLVCPF